MFIYRKIKSGSDIRIKSRVGDSFEVDNTVAMIDTWYDRHQRIWVTQLKNKAGDQIGDAIYSWNKKAAMEENKTLKKEYGIQ